MRLIFTKFHLVLGIILITTFHHNSTQAFTAICAGLRWLVATSRHIDPGSISGDLLWWKQWRWDSCNPSTFTVHCQYHSTRPSLSLTYHWHYIIWTIKGKAVPLQGWSGPEGSRKLSFPYFMTTAQVGGKVVSLTHRPPLPPGNTRGTHFC